VLTPLNRVSLPAFDDDGATAVVQHMLMSSEDNSRAHRFRDLVEPALRTVVARSASPGVVVAAAYDLDKPPLVACAGHLTYEVGSSAATPTTIYDLASVTKLFTACVAMRLRAEGVLDLETRVCSILPEFENGDRREMTLGHLLSHTSGYMAWTPLYRTVRSPSELKARVRNLPLLTPPGAQTIYSDLGMILLGEVLERVTGSPLDELVSALVTHPLGFESTRYLPPAKLHERVAPTENDPWRRRVLRGEVHDENAAAMGGVAAHAGIFSTAIEVARLGAALLPSAKGRFIQREIADAFLAPHSDPGEGWVYGARRLAGDSRFGQRLSPSSVGLTGFTGTLIAIDDKREAAVAVLSNRVHPTRRNTKLNDLRGGIIDAALSAIDAMKRTSEDDA
jgi:CubicO group peptidase (beta-lactamase class C family)